MNLNELEVGSSSSSSNGPKKMYTGLAPIQIKMVNPSAKQIADFYGIEESKVKDPNYVKEDAEITTRLDFFYESHPDSKHDLKGKFSVFIRNKPRESKSGKKQYIDNYAKTSWANNLSELSANQQKVKEFMRLDIDSAREAYPGEETIYKLLKAYGNIVPRTKPLKLSNWKDLIKGNGAELEKFFEFFNNNNAGVMVMMGVRDWQYQDVFTGHFMTLGSKLSDYDKRQIEGDYGFKSFYDGYVFSEYSQEDAPESNEVEASSSADDSMITSSTSKEEENPFLM